MQSMSFSMLSVVKNTIVNIVDLRSTGRCQTLIDSCVESTEEKKRPLTYILQNIISPKSVL